MYTDLPDWASKLCEESATFRDLLKEAKQRECFDRCLETLEREGISIDDYNLEPTPWWREFIARFWVQSWSVFPSLANVARLLTFWFSIVSGIMMGGTLMNLMLHKKSHGWLGFLIVTLLFGLSIQIHRGLKWLKKRASAVARGDTSSFEGIVKARRHGLLSHKRAQKEMVKLYWRHLNYL